MTSVSGEGHSWHAGWAITVWMMDIPRKQEMERKKAEETPRNSVSTLPCDHWPSGACCCGIVSIGANSEALGKTPSHLPAVKRKYTNKKGQKRIKCAQMHSIEHPSKTKIQCSP